MRGTTVETYRGIRIYTIGNTFYADVPIAEQTCDRLRATGSPIRIKSFIDAYIEKGLIYSGALQTKRVRHAKRST